MINATAPASYKAVRYDHFGGTDVLYLTQLPKPSPAPDQVLVRVRAAGINPGEASIRKGILANIFPSTFPSGQGSDFAGTIEAVGSAVTEWNVNDDVIGFSHNRDSQAEYVLVKPQQLVKRPANVSWEQGGSLFVAGTTAYAGVQVLGLKPGEVVVVSGAAGGVGSLAVQLAKQMGAEVIGLASEPNHDWLRRQGVTPVAYGNDTEHVLQKVLQGRPVDAFFDTIGGGYVDLALEMNVPPARINTIIDFEAAAKHGVQTAGNAQGGNATVLSELAQLISTGKLELIVASTYPLEAVRAAYDELEARHTHGKIVLLFN